MREDITSPKKKLPPVIEVTEKTYNTEISRNKHLHPDRKTVSSSYPCNNSHCGANTIFINLIKNSHALKRYVKF